MRVLPTLLQPFDPPHTTNPSLLSTHPPSHAARPLVGLEALHLARCGITDTGAEALMAALLALMPAADAAAPAPVPSRLRHIDLSGNALGDATGACVRSQGEEGWMPWCLCLMKRKESRMHDRGRQRARGRPRCVRALTGRGGVDAVVPAFCLIWMKVNARQKWATRLGMPHARALNHLFLHNCCCCAPTPMHVSSLPSPSPLTLARS